MSIVLIPHLKIIWRDITQGMVASCFLSLGFLYRKPSDGGKKDFRKKTGKYLDCQIPTEGVGISYITRMIRELHLHFLCSGLYTACWEAEGGPCLLEVSLSTMITWHVIISQGILHMLCLEKNFLTPAWVENKYVNHTLPGYAPSFSEEKEHEKKWYISPKERGLCRLSRREKKVLIM